HSRLKTRLKRKVWFLAWGSRQCRPHFIFNALALRTGLRLERLSPLDEFDIFGPVRDCNNDFGSC
ncbi:hypothetical protein ACFLWC_07890, partial [Chloroflexota bacterium]